MSTLSTNLERVRRLSTAARESKQLAADDVTARDAAIEEAKQAHASVRDIARAAKLSSSGVQAILVRRAAERQQRAVEVIRGD